MPNDDFREGRGVSQIMTLDDFGGGGVCLFSKPMKTSFVNNPLPLKSLSDIQM